MWILSLSEVQPVSANVSPIALHDLKRSWMNRFSGNGACINGSLRLMAYEYGWDRLSYVRNTEAYGFCHFHAETHIMTSTHAHVSVRTYLGAQGPEYV